jgi:hypothetical protein
MRYSVGSCSDMRQRREWNSQLSFHVHYHVTFHSKNGVIQISPIIKSSIHQSPRSSPSNTQKRAYLWKVDRGGPLPTTWKTTSIRCAILCLGYLYWSLFNYLRWAINSGYSELSLRTKSLAVQDSQATSVG